MEVEQKKNYQWKLLSIAVVIMGGVSSYTTAVGLLPMVENIYISWAIAIALSIFMIAIALFLPQAYQDGNHRQLIFGYSIVAIFSVILNFNAIYGLFTAENLLYNELTRNRSELAAIRTSADEALKNHYGVTKVQKSLDSLRRELKYEIEDPRNQGFGDKASAIYRQLPRLEADSIIVYQNFNPISGEIEQKVDSSLSVIDQAIRSTDKKSYRNAIEYSLQTYGEIGESVSSIVGRSAFNYHPLVFENRDVGNLNHSIWTLMNFYKLTGMQIAALMGSLFLSFLIDFIVLFVILLVNKPSRNGRVLNKTEKNRMGIWANWQGFEKSSHESTSNRNGYTTYHERDE